jgi:hypothetical protein
MEKNSPWYNGPDMLLVCGMFLIYNSLMAAVMIGIVFAPISNGICQV